MTPPLPVQGGAAKPTIRIGFTGTRFGMSKSQGDELTMLLSEYAEDEDVTVTHFHHGDCKGSDLQAHRFVKDFVPEWLTVGHPPTRSSWRAFCDCHELRKPKPYLERDDDIVRETDILIATPMSMENRSGGTWYTIRRAVEWRKTLFLIAPDGEHIENVKALLLGVRQ